MNITPLPFHPLMGTRNNLYVLEKNLLFSCCLLCFIRICFFFLSSLSCTLPFCLYCITHTTQISMPRDTNRQFQQARGHRPTPYNARPLGSAVIRTPDRQGRTVVAISTEVPHLVTKCLQINSFAMVLFINRAYATRRPVVRHHSTTHEVCV